MRWACLVLFVCLPVSAAFAQDSAYEAAVIVLNDGRVIGTNGDYEIYGDEVRFTDHQGRTMSLSLKRVNLEESDRQTKELRQKNRKALESGDGEDDLVSQVEAWQRNRPKSDEQADEPKFYRETQADEVLEQQEIPEELKPYEDEILAALKWLEQRVNINSQPLRITGIFFGVLLILASLISFITQIVLLFKSFDLSKVWFFFLFVGMFGPLLGFFLACLGSELFMAVSIITNLISLIYPILVLVFILLHCEGSRIRYLFFWLLPLVVMILAVAVLAGVIFLG